jgi:uncharacterized membrane protein (DUF485 family)
VRAVLPEEWSALAAEPEFRALVRSRRRFIVPATLFFIAYDLALPVGVGFWPHVMSRPVLGPLTLAYCFALSEFAMVWALMVAYVIRARSFDARAAAVRALEARELQEPPER